MTREEMADILGPIQNAGVNAMATAGAALVAAVLSRLNRNQKGNDLPGPCQRHRRPEDGVAHAARVGAWMYRRLQRCFLTRNAIESAVIEDPDGWRGRGPNRRMASVV
jgi:hypothetical protein